MFAVEALVLVLSVLALTAWSLGRDYLRKRRDRREAAEVEARLAKIATFEDARNEFGFPEETLDGPSGRRLCVWKKPTPDGRLFTYSLTISPEGKVLDRTWKRTPTR
ncbi:MAG: hypothetical protein SFV18_04090 [Bryobacteraceae bacterium]|nr:hypothetical protein [Bryobacteraceae bacterium]